MLEHFKKMSVRIDRAQKMTPEELDGKIIVGEFVNTDKPELSAQWTNLKNELTEAI